MLQEMRKYTRSWVASAFLGALALSFALWGVADIFRGRSDTSAFTIGSTVVPIEAFQRDYRNQASRAGIALPPEEQKILGEQVLERMTELTALDSLGDDLGLTASDARVRAVIQTAPQFNGPLGSFDRETFLQAITRVGYSEKEFVELVRRDTARDQLVTAVQGGFVMPGDYARAIYSFVNETRAVEYVVLTAAMLGNIAPPSDAELQAYVKAHPEKFSTAEYRSVDMVTIGADDLAPTIAVSDKDIAKEIADHRSEYVVDEKREIEQINFKTEDEAKAAKAALDGGKTFEALAADRKLKDADFKLGDVTKTDLGFNPAGADAAFALPAGATSAPVKGPFGWVLMHVVKITAGSAKSNDEVKQALQRKIAWGRIQDMMNAYGEEIDNGASMAVAAKKAHLNFLHIPAVDAKGNGPDGKKVLPSDSEALLDAIAKAEIGDEGDTFPTPDLHYFAIRVNGVTPPKLKAFDAVRADALKAWTEDKRLALLKARAQDLTAKANKDHALAAAAAAAGAPVQSSPALKRQTNEGLFKANVVTAIFAAAPGGAVQVPVDGGGIMIARVTGIAHPPPTPGDMQFLQGAQEISRAISGDLTRLLAKAIEAKKGFTVNQRMIDQTVSGNGGQ
jgi:peptidyl-prolyl cis-trans isomerase D